MRLRLRQVRPGTWVCDVIRVWAGGFLVHTTDEYPRWDQAEDAAARWVADCD